VEKHQHNAYQQGLYTDLNRISSLGDKRLMDHILHRMLFTAGGSPNVKVVNNASAYFPDDSCLVEHVSGDRGTGVTFSVAVGLGFKKFASGQPDADSPEFLPIFIDSADSVVTTGSDSGDPRIDRIYLKPAYADENQDTINIIDPSPPNNITAESRYLNHAYRYELAYVAGTPDPAPSAPSAPSGFIDADGIADILIQPGSGAFNPSDLTDTRTLLEMDDQLVPAVTSLPADQIVVDPTVLGQAEVQAALGALSTGLGTVVPRGLLNAKLNYVDTENVQLDVALGTLIQIEIDGVVLTDAGPIIFDLSDAADREGAQTEDASTLYYLYVYNSAGTILHKLSKTAPVLNVALKVGYHPTSTGWRCVGFIFNDDSSNICPFTASAREMKFKEFASDYFWALSRTLPLAWTTLDLSTMVPEGACSVEFIHMQYVDDAQVAFGASDASVALSAGDAAMFYDDASMADAIVIHSGVSPGGGTRIFLDLVFSLPIVDRSSPAIRYGNVEEFGANFDHSDLKLLAIQYPFLPLF
jgi:hypothetical protein